MTKEEYQKLVKKLTPSEDKIKNAFMAFTSGGIVGLISSIIYKILLSNNLSVEQSTTWTLIIIIFLSSLATATSYFDNVVSKFKCGIIIPITGFAHSITASALDYKKDGLITGLGSNIFKLAGSVLLYGIISSYLLVMVKVVILWLQ